MSIRTIARTALLAFSCAFVAACASGPAHPAGWTDAGKGVWTSGLASFTISSNPYDGTMKQLASEETVNQVLRGPGTRFVRSDPYPDCPGLGALMTFERKHPPTTILRAFTIRESTATFVTYARPSGTPADAAAMSAMKQTICNE